MTVLIKILPYSGFKYLNGVRLLKGNIFNHQSDSFLKLRAVTHDLTENHIQSKYYKSFTFYSEF